MYRHIKYAVALAVLWSRNLLISPLQSCTKHAASTRRASPPHPLEGERQTLPWHHHPKTIMASEYSSASCTTRPPSTLTASQSAPSRGTPTSRLVRIRHHSLQTIPRILTLFYIADTNLFFFVTDSTSNSAQSNQINVQPSCTCPLSLSGCNAELTVPPCSGQHLPAAVSDSRTPQRQSGDVSLSRPM